MGSTTGGAPTLRRRGDSPLPIAEMDAWSFWARPDAVGLAAPDAQAVKDGTADAEVQLRMTVRAEQARCWLAQLPAPSELRS